MMVARLPLLAAALMAWQGAAAPSADRVDALPGWDGALPSQWWSGYVNVSGAFGEASMHYVFVESEGDPSTDPVIIWCVFVALRKQLVRVLSGYKHVSSPAPTSSSHHITY